MTAFEREQELQLIKNMKRWPGWALCMKKRPKPSEKTGIMGYSAFGIITTSQLPLVIYLQPEFDTEVRYNTIEEALDDGWMVD